MLSGLGMQKALEFEISHRIYVVREHRVMLGSDLADLYRVKTKVLNQSVKRNASRFPVDFMFQLTETEEESLRSKTVTSKINGRGGRRYPTNAFTELGIAMLSSILNSEQAIQTNIRIMRTFFELRKLLRRDPKLAERVGQLEKNSNLLFEVIFERLDQIEIKIPLLPPGRKKIGI